MSTLWTLQRNGVGRTRGQRIAGPSLARAIPGARRGIVPLIAAAVASGAARTGFGILGARKRGDQARQLIYDAYTRGRPRLDLHQGDVRQSEVESLGARGLTGGGGVMDTGAVQPQESPDQSQKNANAIKGAIASGQPLGASAIMKAIGAAGPVMTGQSTSVTGAQTLGGQAVADLRREQGLEQDDLLAQRNAAIKNTRVNQSQDVINAIGAGVDTGMNVYGAGQDMSALGAIKAGAGVASSVAGSMLPGAAGAGQFSPIQSAMGVHNPANWFGGINGLDPLNAPGSSWATPTTDMGAGGDKGTVVGNGQDNINFHRG